MARAKKLCSHVGPEGSCTSLMPCEAHAPQPWAGSTRSRELPPDWERRRKRVLRRDVLCQDGRVCRGLSLATECHHTGQRDDHSIESLQGVCTDCHKAITVEQATRSRIAAR